MKPIDLLLRCTKGHTYAPGALEVHMKGFAAMSPRDQIKALGVYTMLLNEPLLPRNLVKK